MATINSASSVTTSSNIDVASIVSQLMTVEQRPLLALNAKEASYQAKLTAYGSIKGALASFQTAVNSLNSTTKFQAVSATSSDNTALTATATSIAVAGTHSLEVSKLAQSQRLVAAGTTSATDSVGSGTLTFDFGTITGTLLSTGKYDVGTTFLSNGNGTKTVTIGTDNSLMGIRDAINSANIGVTASIVNDGSGTPYRLTVSASSLGKDTSMKISVSGDVGLSSLLAHDPATTTQNLSETTTAQNAEFKVDGVSISKNSNTVSDVLQGLNITLGKVTTSAVTLTVARDTATIRASVESFSKAYNDLNKTLRDVSAYNPTTQQGAILQGDATVRTVQSQLRSILNTAVSNNGSMTNLSQIGLSFQKDGTLALDSTKLNAAISSNFTGIAGLFATMGSATDLQASYVSATSTTQAGTYSLNISQIATQGTLVGSASAGLTITTGVNDIIDLSINGTAASIVLAAGTYASATTLAAEVQSKINSVSALSSAGIAVNVTQNTGVLSILSRGYGSTSSAAITGGNGAVNLLGASPVQTNGLHVAGTINGVAATGSGQTLTSDVGNSIGLSILISGGLLGNRGSVSYSHGYAFSLDKALTSMLATNGSLDGRTQGINNTIKDIGKQRDALNVRLAEIETRYRTQFTALDSMLSSMNQTSTYLTQQFDIMQSQTKNF